MSPEIQVQRLLKAHEFVLVRQDRHKVYRNPQSKIFVTAATPSDWRAWANSLSDLKRVIQNPPTPMVQAISDFERQQAAAVIQPQQKNSEGHGRTKQRRSHGTGFVYEDRKTPESRAHEQRQREEIEVARQRRDIRARMHRAEQLERKFQRLEKERRISALVNGLVETQINPCLGVAEKNIMELSLAHAESKAWQADCCYYEFEPKDSARDSAHAVFSEFMRSEMRRLDLDDTVRQRDEVFKGMARGLLRDTGPDEKHRRRLKLIEFCRRTVRRTGADFSLFLSAFREYTRRTSNITDYLVFERIVQILTGHAQSHLNRDADVNLVIAEVETEVSA